MALLIESTDNFISHSNSKLLIQYSKKYAQAIAEINFGQYALIYEINQCSTTPYKM